jgi:hypothetical protein
VCRARLNDTNATTGNPSDYDAHVGSRAAAGRLSAAGEPVLNYYHVLGYPAFECREKGRFRSRQTGFPVPIGSPSNRRYKYFNGRFTPRLSDSVRNQGSTTMSHSICARYMTIPAGLRRK